MTLTEKEVLAAKSATFFGTTASWGSTVDDL
mgnify:FL=1